MAVAKTCQIVVIAHYCVNAQIVFYSCGILGNSPLSLKCYFFIELNLMLFKSNLLIYMCYSSLNIICSIAHICWSLKHKTTIQNV